MSKKVRYRQMERRLSEYIYIYIYVCVCVCVYILVSVVAGEVVELDLVL